MHALVAVSVLRELTEAVEQVDEVLVLEHIRHVVNKQVAARRPRLVTPTASGGRTVGTCTVGTCTVRLLPVRRRWLLRVQRLRGPVRCSCCWWRPSRYRCTQRRGTAICSSRVYHDSVGGLDRGEKGRCQVGIVSEPCAVAVRTWLACCAYGCGCPYGCGGCP